MKDLKGKKLLILAGAAVHVKVAEAAKEMGIYTIVTDYLEASPAKKVADESWMLNITDVDGIVEKCKQEKVDGVINFCIDPAQIPYQQICEKLGFPSYGNAEQVHKLTNKQEFIKLCKECGVDVIPQYTEKDIEEGSVSYPIFIKPVDSRGSRGQSVCYTKEEADKAVTFAKKESESGEVIIEKYMAGHDDFSMTYTVKDGQAYLTRTGDRHLGSAEDGLNKQAIAGISPSKYSEMYLENVDKKVKSLIKKLGIKNGPVFMQGFVDGETVRFYDPGLRYPGTDYEKLLYAATGINLMKMMITFALTGSCGDCGSLEDAYLLEGKVSTQLYIPARPGKITVYEGLEKIAENPYVVTVSPRTEIGETIIKSGDVRQRVAEIVMLAPNKEKAKELIKYVYETFKVCDEEKKDMLVSKFDTDKM